MSTEIGLFSDCHFHQVVCGGIVIAGQDVCDTCRREWGPLLRPVTATKTQPDTIEHQAPPWFTRARNTIGPVRTPGQTCWLCERVKHCVKTMTGWECAECVNVT